MTTPIAPSERRARARHGYSSYRIVLHWSVMVLVVVNWLLGQGMQRVFEAREEGEVITNLGPAYVHIALGILIFLTMIARLSARIRQPVEVAPESKHRVMALLGLINHWAFYGVLLAMPPLGVLAWFFGLEWPGDLHSLLSWVLVVLIALHVGGVILHLLLGENIIRRMTRPAPCT